MSKSNIAKIKDNFDKYIVRPANLFGFGGFIFDVEGESSVTLTNEITDHFVEDKTSIQDQIAVRPKTITLTNYVGEIADTVDDSDGGFTQKVARKLTVVNGYLPELTAGAEQAQEAIQNLIRDRENIGDIDLLDIEFNDLLDVELPSINRISDLYGPARNFIRPQTKQAEAYQYFKALRDQKILLSVQTPFEFMTNMAIETIIARQTADTRTVSDFTVTLKEIRFATTDFATLTEQGRRALQASDIDNLSKIEGQNEDISILKQRQMDNELTGIFSGLNNQ